MSSFATEIAALPGLDHAKTAVRRILAAGPGVHAVLFYGPSGAGKEKLARLLAQSWMCPSPVEGMACGECAVCKAFEAGRAVDFQFVYPWGPSNLIKLSVIRQVVPPDNDPDRPPVVPVIDFFRTRPLMARCKVEMFDQAHRMNSDVANAFLKTLEEPAPDAKIILTTSEFTRLIPTIRSRCMCVACELPADLEGSSLSPTEQVFGGSPGGVAHVREHAEVFQRLYDVLEASKSEPWGAAFRLAEECRAAAEAYAKATDSNARGANAKVLECIGAWLATERPDRPQLLQATAEAHRRILGNAQASIVFEYLFLDLQYHG